MKNEEEVSRWRIKVLNTKKQPWVLKLEFLEELLFGILVLQKEAWQTGDISLFFKSYLIIWNMETEMRMGTSETKSL